MTSSSLSLTSSCQPHDQIPRSKTPGTKQKSRHQNLFPYPAIPLQRSMPDVKGKGKAQGVLQSIRSAISLRSIRTIPISINPFSSPNMSPTNRNGSWQAKFLGGTFASQEGLSPYPSFRSGSKRRHQTDICGVKPLTIFGMSLVLTEVGIMSLCASIGAVVTDLRRGVSVGVVAWLVVSAVVAVGGAMCGSLVFILAQSQKRLGGWDVEDRVDGRDVAGMRGVSSEDPGIAAAQKSDEWPGIEDAHLKMAKHKIKQELDMESPQRKEFGRDACHRGEDDAVLMMKSERHKHRSHPSLRVITEVPQSLSRDENLRDRDSHDGSWKELQAVIERDTNRYVQGDERPRRSQVAASTSNANTAAVAPFQNQLNSVTLHPSIVKNLEQEQAYLELRRQHFEAINRNHFLGLDHGVLDEMAPRARMGGRLGDQRLSSM